MGSSSAKQHAQHIPVGTDQASIQKRKELFKTFDTDANNLISLLQFYKGLHEVLNVPKLFDTVAVVVRSYGLAVLKVKEQNPIPEGQQLQMTPGVFKWTLMYIRFYYEIWGDFQRMEVERENQEFITLNQLLKGQENLIKNWNLKTDDPERIFQEVMKEYQEEHRISFMHFCDYLIREKFQQYEDLEAHSMY